MALFDLSGAVAVVAIYDVSVLRFNKDTYDEHGRAEPRTYTTIAAKASVQPVSGKDILRMPEGVDSSDMVTVHTATPLMHRDRLVIPEKGYYEVEKVLAWGDIGGFCKVLARKLNDSEARS